MGWTFWLDKLPVKELMNLGVISKCHLTARNKPEVVKDLLHFFGVGVIGGHIIPVRRPS